MSFKAYFVSAATPREIEIVNNYVEKFNGIAIFNYYAVTKKGIKKPFIAGQTIAAITVDRGDLVEAFCEEDGGVCTLEEMPRFRRLEEMPLNKHGEPKFMDIQEDKEEPSFYDPSGERGPFGGMTDAEMITLVQSLADEPEFRRKQIAALLIHSTLNPLSAIELAGFAQGLAEQEGES